MKVWSLILALATIGCATVPQSAGEDPEGDTCTCGQVAGEPRICLPDRDATAVAYRGAILYTVGRNLVWRNDAGGCPFAGRDDILVTERFGSQPCRGDRIRFVDRAGGGVRGACVLSAFVPYRAAR